MNILEQSETLKDIPEQVLMKEMQMPSGSFPQYLVLTEIKRRKRIRDDFQRRQAQDVPTVAEEAVTAAGVPQEGIMQMSKAMAPKTNMGQNTGMADMMPKQPVMGMNQGGFAARPGPMPTQVLTSIANLKVNYPDVYNQYKDDPNALAYIASTLGAESATTPELTGLEELEAPRNFDTLQNLFTDPSNRAVTKKQLEIEAGQADRAIQAQIDTANRLRGTTEDDPLFTEGTPVDFLPEDQVYKFPRTAEASGIEGLLSAPDAPLDGLPSGGAAPSQVEMPSLSSLLAPTGTDSATIQGSPTTDFSIEPGSPAETDAIREFLANERSQGLADQSKTVIDFAENNELGALERRFTTSDDPINNLVNKRAQEYLQSDMYTPPEDIYDLGPKGRIKYETEDPAERDKLFAETAQREFLERQAADAAAEQRAIDLDNQIQAQNRAADRIGDRIGQDQPLPPLSTAERIASSIADTLGNLNTKGQDRMIGREADKSSEVVLGDGAEVIDPNTTAKAREDAQRKAAEDVAKVIEDANKNAASISSRGSASAGSLESRIAKAIADREKRAESDKWLALAQTGLIMASGDPADLKTAGTAGLKALSDARARKDKFTTDMLTLQQRIDAYKARIAGAAAKSGITSNQMLQRGTDLVKQGQDIMLNAGDNADVAGRGQQLIDYGNALIDAAMGGTGQSASSGSKTVKIS